MWRQMASNDYDAVFYAYMNMGANIPKLALYNIINPSHPQYKSTVSMQTLDRLGLSYLPPPKE